MNLELTFFSLPSLVSPSLLALLRLLRRIRTYPSFGTHPHGLPIRVSLELQSPRLYSSRASSFDDPTSLPIPFSSRSFHLPKRFFQLQQQRKSPCRSRSALSSFWIPVILLSELGLTSVSLPFLLPPLSLSPLLPPPTPVPAQPESLSNPTSSLPSPPSNPSNPSSEKPKPSPPTPPSVPTQIEGRRLWSSPTSPKPPRWTMNLGTPTSRFWINVIGR